MLVRAPAYGNWMATLSADSRRASHGLPEVKYTYGPTGSSDGKAKLIAGKAHFAGSDSPLSASEKSALPSAWFLPTLAGGVALGFNVPGFGTDELNLPREALADVFLGRIWQWSGLAPWNPRLENTTENISIIVRSDSSGTTSVFTSALSSFSTEWKASIGTSSLPNWPKATARCEGNSGVAVSIRVTAYSIGYLGVAEARSFGVSYAKIGNAAGQYISPTAAAVQEAMSAFGTQFEALARDRSTNFFVDIVDPQNSPAAYPIATFTYIVFNTDLLACETLLNVVYMIYWAWTDGAVEMASNQPLVPLTETVRSACMSALGGLKCDGKAPLARAQIAFGLGCQPGASNTLLLLVLLASLFSSNFPCKRARCEPFIVAQASSRGSEATEDCNARLASLGSTPRTSTRSLRHRRASRASQVQCHHWIACSVWGVRTKLDSTLSQPLSSSIRGPRAFGEEFLTIRVDTRAARHALT